MNAQMTDVMASCDMRIECLKRMVQCSLLWSDLTAYIDECRKRCARQEYEFFRSRWARLMEINGFQRPSSSNSDDSANPSLVSGAADSSDCQRSGVTNLSKLTLTDSEIHVLNLGLNFSVTPRSLDVADVCASVEAAVKRVDVPDRAWVRGEAGRIIKSYDNHRFTCNLTRQEREALSSIRRRTDIVILPADKGNRTVVLDKDVYFNKLSLLVSL